MKTAYFRTWAGGCSVVFALVLVGLAALPLVASGAQTATALQGQVAAPKVVQVQWQPSVPEIPAGICPECNLGKINRQLPKPAVKLPEGMRAPDVPATAPEALPGDFHFFKKHVLTDAESSTSTANVLEPTAAQASNKILYTGNWFAAKSTDNGTTFTYVNPYTIFTPPTGMVFCCDQEVIYDRTRGMWIWSLLYITPNVQGGCNRIAISTDLVNWWYYDLNYSTTELPDFPHLRLGDNYLYLTTNQFNPNFRVSRIIRLPLTDMRFAKGFGYLFWDTADVFTFTVAKNFGLQDTVYWASNTIVDGPANAVRVYYWEETSGTLFWNTITVVAWNWTPFICTAPDGTNPCGRMDDRILGAAITGWGAPGVSDKVLWLSWNAAPITGHPTVYTYVVKINPNNWTVLGYADVWNSTLTWGYTAISPNDRGHLGLVTNALGGAVYTQLYVSLYDDLTPSPPPGWQVFLVQAGNIGPADNSWGDYNCVDRNYPKGFQWVGSGHVKTTADPVRPWFVRFGRYRDK
jgi:hypothetical protein